MLFKYILFIFAIKISLISNSALPKADNDVMNIAVYYESLCPDSRRFIINGLSQVISNPNFRQITNIILVPYGKANVT